MGRVAAFVLVLTAAMLALGLVDCASSCTPTLRYAIPDGPNLPGVSSDGGPSAVSQTGLNVSDHKDADCWITFSHGSIVAEYHLAPFPPPSPELGPASPNPYACANELFSTDARESCEVIKGPTPDECFRTADCIEAHFGFRGTSAPALEQFLGSTTYDVQVMCGNDVIGHATAVKAKSEICAL